MNLAIYGFGEAHRRKWIAVDLGVSFGGDDLPGIDLIMPDIRFLVEERRNLLGLVLTHAHEDHFGAVLDLWPRLKVPVYATPFTAALLEAKRQGEPGAPQVPVTIVPLGGRFTLGPFDIELVSVAHSIPESNGLIIRTPLGTVLHTGDWKIDPTPVLGPPTDEPKLRALGNEGCLALIGDSTNAVREGRSPSETEVAKTLAELIRTAPGRVAVTTFASNVGRLRSVAKAAAACDREVVLVGRAMERITQVARETGYLDGIRDFRSVDVFGYLPPDKVVALCTGSQGEARAALSRIAAGRSSRGELLARRPRDLLLARHSGQREGGDAGDQRPGRARRRGHHRSRPPGARVRPSAPGRAAGHDRLGAPADPDPGAWRDRCIWPSMPRSRAAPASPKVITCRNGDLVRLAPQPGIIDEVPAGRLYKDGSLLVGAAGAHRSRTGAGSDSPASCRSR